MTLHPAIFALGVVLAASASGADPRDYELTLLPFGERICTTSIEVCETALHAIRRVRPKLNWIPLGEEDSPIDGLCTPGCQDELTLCISRYGCR